MIHAYWLKKLTSHYAQINQPHNGWDPLWMANQMEHSSDPEEPPKGSCPIQLQADNPPLYNVEAQAS